MNTKKLTILKIICIICIIPITLNFEYFSVRNDYFEYLEEEKYKLQEYKNRLSYLESSNDWTVVNRLGYIGKYQFGQMALKELGIELKPSKFKNNPDLLPENIQDSLIVEYIKLNKRYLGDYIDKYVGETINDIKITSSGIFAACHLVGYRKVKMWLDSNGNRNFFDGNGISLEKYLNHFSDLEINVDLLK